MMLPDEDELEVVDADARHELLRDVLIALERFNDRHGYGLDLAARMDLLNQVTAAYFDEFMADLEAPRLLQ